LFAIPEVIKAVRARGNFVVKPACGSGGDGILVVGRLTPKGWMTAGGGTLRVDDLRQHLANVVFGAYSNQLKDQALLEERIVPHPFFDELYADGLCDIRLLVLRGKALMAMVRVPTQRSGGRANLHQGGIGLAVDLASGRTTRALSRRRELRVHPENGIALVGRDIPVWSDILDVGRRAALSVPLGYVGVDIVVDASRGPLVLELNARPGLEIQNVNAQALGPLVRGRSR
jgi:alpha-L-glutamate ligase-like protein